MRCRTSVPSYSYTPENAASFEFPPWHGTVSGRNRSGGAAKTVCCQADAAGLIGLACRTFTTDCGGGGMESTPFIRRLQLAWRVLLDAAFAGEIEAGLRGLQAQTAVQPPERIHASGLLLLATLQREGRLVDFLQQQVAGFSDEEIGAAARVVHTGCRKALQQACDLEPVLRDPEGSPVRVDSGFDAQRIRLTGNVTGQPPFRGTLKHHGWVAKAIHLPDLPNELDPRVIAPAEVELP